MPSIARPITPKNADEPAIAHTLTLTKKTMSALVARLFLITAALFLPASAAPNHTNIVLIFADDLGWTDTAVYGSKFYETPNIDKLASQGMRFTQYQNCPNCQPTCAALMSGQYGPRTGVYTVGRMNRFNWQSRLLLLSL
jgi:hypothetical protein